MKKLCLIEQGKYVDHQITLNKKQLWQSEKCDYIRFNWYTNDDPNATYTPKDAGENRLRWSEGRDFLFSKVIDKYEYILYTDEDTVIQHYDNKNPHDELISFIEEWNPIGLNIHTTNIWCHDERIIKKNMNGYPCLVRKHDACNSILRNDIAKMLHPIKYHGSDAVTHYQQFLCHTLRGEYYMSPPNLYAMNMIEEQHYHIDDRNLSWQSKIIENFGNDLKENKSWIDFTKNKSVTTDQLVDMVPKKNAPLITKEEFQALFKEEIK